MSTSLFVLREEVMSQKGIPAIEICGAMGGKKKKLFICRRIAEMAVVIIIMVEKKIVRYRIDDAQDEELLESGVA